MAEETLDRSTGELVTVSKGDWITITELGDRYGVSRIKVRAVLRKMDFLYVPGGQAHQRHRLAPWVVQAGFGKFIPAKAGGPRNPFDVISPEGQEWIAARWEGVVSALDAITSKPVLTTARQALTAFLGRQDRTPLNAQGQVLWLCDHHPSLSHTEMASLVGVSQQFASRHASLQQQQRQALRLRITAPLHGTAKVQLRHELFGDTCGDICGDTWPPAEQDRLPTSTPSAKTLVEDRLAA